MKPTELRIGNIAQTQNGDMLRVSELKENSIVYKVEDRSKYPPNYTWQAEPIFITKEWIEKHIIEFRIAKNYPHAYCFPTEDYAPWYSKEEDVDNGYGYRDVYQHSIVYNEKEDNWIYGDTNDPTSPNTIRKIKYVHQLQNLYFALTDRELEIKEP